MNEVRNILIGFELRREFSQFCYYDRKAQDPISIPMKVGTNEYEFSTHLSKKKGEDTWRFGMEADYFASQEGWIGIDSLYDLCESVEPVMVDEEERQPFELMGEFLKETLKMLGIAEPIAHISGLMITTEELSRNMVLNLRKACMYAGFEKGQFFVQDFHESFYYHTFYQRPEIWNRRVALFHFHDDKVSYEDLILNPKPRPMAVTLTKGKTIELNPNPKERDMEFYQLIQDSFKNYLFSGVFLTGEGFDKAWAVKSIALLCKNQRKVFYGNNLFAKGACYAVKERLEEHNLKGYLYEGQDLVKTNIGMEMTIQGTQAYYSMVMAGVNWYEAEKECEFLLDDTSELVFSVHNMESQERTRYRMQLSNLPQRPNKTTRIHLSVEFESPHKCQIVAKDMGFGEMYASSGQIWTDLLEV
ncbi:MAG: DUF5716 family protein [Lachnospiraceae bacterium]|nr:DUF5716 family protein [Lachnospiraceae bacterium]MDD3616181.1 DUF5716 family protein [Lachnospiraceae bacterium]